MGGWVTITAGAEHPGEIGGIVIIDTPVRRVSPEEEAATQRTAFGPLRVYGTAQMARVRFRTTPEQPTSLPFVIEHVAAASLRQVEGGWTWKFDPAVFQWDRPRSEVLERVACRVALLRAEHGLVTSDIGEQMYELLGRSAPVIEIPLAWHHIMLDQPIALITALRTLLADWEHSLPHRRALNQPTPESGT
jgi:pimeloyl-ACP methyl ester carboxylesterase